MKKLIAIAVVFVLVAGAAFAADVGVDLFGGITLLEGSSAKTVPDGTGFKTADATAGGQLGCARFSASGQNDDGNFGGSIRFQVGPDPVEQGKGVIGWGWFWWKPIEIFKFQIGTNGGDGEFGLDGVARWGFYQVAGDVGVVDPNSAWGDKWAWYGMPIGFGKAFYGGYNGGGAVLTLTPVDALSINIGIPFWNEAGKPADQVFKKTEGQITYSIDNIGKVGLTIIGDLTDRQDGGTPANDNPEMLFYFGLTAVENLGIDFGIGYKFADSVKIDGVGTTTINNPLFIGLGANYNAGAFGIKFRTVIGFGANNTFVPDSGSTVVTEEPFVMLLDVLPSFAVTDNVTILLSAGMGLIDTTKDSDGKELAPSRTAWHINPYITVKGGWWAPNFYAGIRLESSGINCKDGTIPGNYDPPHKNEGDAVVKWSIPIGIAFSF